MVNSLRFSACSLSIFTVLNNIAGSGITTYDIGNVTIAEDFDNVLLGSPGVVL